MEKSGGQGKQSASNRKQRQLSRRNPRQMILDRGTRDIKFRTAESQLIEEDT